MVDPPRKRYNTSTLLEQFQKPARRNRKIGIGIATLLLGGLIYLVFFQDVGPPTPTVEEMFAKKTKSVESEVAPASAPASVPTLEKAPPALPPPPEPPPAPTTTSKQAKKKLKKRPHR